MGIWIGGKFSDGFCIPISIHEVCRSIGLFQNREKHLTSLCKEVEMIYAKVVPRKYGMVDIMVDLKDA